MTFLNHGFLLSETIPAPSCHVFVPPLSFICEIQRYLYLFAFKLLSPLSLYNTRGFISELIRRGCQGAEASVRGRSLRTREACHP